MSEPTLSVRGLTKTYGARPTLLRRDPHRLTAVDEVGFEIAPGQTLGLVGESGAGKSTVGRLVLRLIEPDAGTIDLLGTDLAALPRGDLRRMRARATMIFQDPYTSLNPRMLIKDAVAEPLIMHTDDSRRVRHAKALDMVRRVGLTAAHMERYPYEMSGGQLQRVAIARALITDPAFIVCDEPVAALDVSTQAQVINLLNDLQQERGISYLFISHDLRLVRLIADEVAVMRRGRLLEKGPAVRLFDAPEHAYTRELLAAIPGRTPRARRFTGGRSEPVGHER
ncbi:ABC transporter ATP-binding protein [Nocardioides albidus]|uniref:ABC transporter ATP-binding protein n=1 Tax=Nocardioides albidus TaxID=1517589 RepID=A0A5C4WRK7_9ACTN|nr:ATP-binding cassette domain-containing protein [Nocardioides albidus]TNM50841.1 ABC transporter ATP-binding protein [Nocardioides albidus]